MDRVSASVFIALFLALASPFTLAQPAGAGDKPSAQRLPKIIPWLEVNVPHAPLERWFPEAARTRPKMNLIDYCIEGLEHWAQVTDVAIVTTKPGGVMSLYPELMDRKPDNLFIIGGLKTYILQGTLPGDSRPYDFADPDGWRRIAEEARKITRITGTNVVVLENEGALKAYHQGKATIDYNKLARSLNVLSETGLQFWWNLPTILTDASHFPNRQAETTRFLKVVAEALPDSVFMAGFTMSHGWERNRSGEVDRRRKMIEILGQDRIQERLLVNTDGYFHYPSRKKRTYTATEALEMMRRLSGKVVNVYPGCANWADVAAQFAKLNKERGFDVP